MQRRDFCKLAATSVAGALAWPWNSTSVQAGQSHTELAANPLPAGGGGPLPKIRVHPGWRGLVTDENKPFVPIGAMYFRANNGWTPRFWKEFDARAALRDLKTLKAMSFNTVRLWLTSLSFYPRPGVLDSEAIEKFDQFLAAAEQAGIYVQVCGLTTWQGRPKKEVPIWQRGDEYADPRAVEDQVQFWSLFASRYKGRPVILTYELANEPTVHWNTPAMQKLWNKFNGKTTPIPPAKDNPGDSALLAFQHFREDVADEWTRRQVDAIKQSDPDALVTIGLIQWSIPAIPNPPQFYSGFRPQRQAKLLDFMEVHFYPLAAGGYRYQSEAIRQANLAYLESVVRETAAPGLPTMLAEFGWYGGGICPHYGRPRPATQQQQADFCAREVKTSTPLVCGWLNWAMYDDPVAADVTRFSGLFTANGKVKVWGRRFSQIAHEYQHQLPPVPLGKIGPRPELPWDACLTSSATAEKFRVEYLAAFQREEFCS
ncbi:MAG: cellulase family glycosylhydrolase [Planctomycetia bacterium]|nr:cellulase family glycosylhydrolase [Planctomycetia bacterium]